MGLARSLILAGSRSAWLRSQAPRLWFVRRTVKRFMPGERLEDALAAAGDLQRRGVPAILTRLGENVTDAAGAREVFEHYEGGLDQVKAAGLDAQISVKLTQLGLDQDPERCHGFVAGLVEKAAALGGQTLWIDMESSEYVDRTLDVYRRLRARHRNVGVALQAYLRRTAADLESLLPLTPSIRIVKGAYLEPPEVAFPNKRDVDESYYRLAGMAWAEASRRPGAFTALGTHDRVLIQRLQALARESAIPREAFEFEMLYGIQQAEQVRLSGAGERLRVLISYGDYWFPWFMRRLAERPANVWFLARSVLSR